MKKGNQKKDCIIEPNYLLDFLHSYQQMLQKLSTYMYTNPYMYSLQDLFKVNQSNILIGGKNKCGFFFRLNQVI